VGADEPYLRLLLADIDHGAATGARGLAQLSFEFRRVLRGGSVAPTCDASSHCSHASSSFHSENQNKKISGNGEYMPALARSALWAGAQRNGHASRARPSISGDGAATRSAEPQAAAGPPSRLCKPSRKRSPPS
jgi:hypothetical protein